MPRSTLRSLRNLLSQNASKAFLAIAAAACGGCTKFDALNALVPPLGYHRTNDIAYGSIPRQKLDVYRPSTGKTPADIVVFFYGGDWQEGSKGDYFFVAQALASRGFVAVLPDYRLYPAVTFPAFVQDGAMAVRWVHDHAAEIGGDPQHVYLMGHSAGAQIAALLTVDASYLKAVGLDRGDIAGAAVLSAPLDFIPPPGDRRALLMKDGDAKPPAITQPIHFVDGRAPPMLLVHGKADKTVSIDGAIHFAQAVQEKGGDISTRYYDGKSHVDVVLSFAFPFRWIAPTLNDVTAYFKSVDQTIAAAGHSTSGRHH